MTSTMNAMLMDKAMLVTALTKNREHHRDRALAAQVAYRKAVIAELDRTLDEVNKGKAIWLGRLYALAVPQDHTRDYDQALEMLNLCLDPHIMCSVTDYRKYVLDEWEWKQTFTTTNASYGIDE